MFQFSKPTYGDIRLFLDKIKNDTYSYSEIGATRLNTPPKGYTVDHSRQLIGRGLDDLARAKQAIRSWKMFDLDWVGLYDENTPIKTGKNLVIVISHLGFYSLNSARIVYTIDESERFGFAYGTLTEHGEKGEERFSVEYDPLTNEVWYDILAFSRPGTFLA